MQERSDGEIRQAVRERYGDIALTDPAGCGCEPSSCCGQNTAPTSDDISVDLGYSREDVSIVPEGANMGLGCGNPQAIAAAQPGETVLDLGSGGGFDCFLAAKAVGIHGHVIGVDMTADMVRKARENAAKGGFRNVEFRLGEIEHIPAADNSINVIISNCVINLSPDKTAVWREIARVLKPGGRVSVSDIALKRALPDQVREAVQALVGCVAGAVMVADTEAMARAAGLADITLEQRDGNIAAMESWHDPLYREIEAGLPSGTTPSDFVTSLAVSARKSGQA